MRGRGRCRAARNICDSEKYEIRVRDCDAPGNIVAEIARAQPHPQSNPALQTHLGLRFYPRASTTRCILYGKPLPARGDMILVAVSLDPFHVQEATIEVPLWEWGLPDSGRGRGRGSDARPQLRLVRQAAADPPRSGRAAVRDLADRTSSPEAARWTHAANNRLTAAAADPLWYKDAIIYQLHVKSFFDAQQRRHRRLSRPDLPSSTTSPISASTRSGCCRSIPSPRLDDGYDISDYRGVHPDYGTLADFRRFVAAAHARGMRVITELVINHTSDQHPWFQRARRAKPGSAAAQFLRLVRQRPEICRHAHHLRRHRAVELDLGPGGRRLLLAPLLLASARPEFRQSAGAARKCSSVMRFWLELGVDGLRLDAVPYLVEREGTNNENLPETHAILKQHPRRARRALSRTACCWPRPISGRRTPRTISATATNATWRFTFR